MKLIFITLSFLTVVFAGNAQSYDWARNLEVNVSWYNRFMIHDNLGNVYMTGAFTGTVDIDPGSGTTNLTSTGGDDIFVVKMNASGNFVWAKSVGGVNNESGMYLSLDGAGNIYVTGSFENTVDFDPGTGTTLLTSNGAADAYILKLDTAGNFVWARGIGGGGDEMLITVAADMLGNVYYTGMFSGSVDFDPGPGVSLLTDNGYFDFFISKIDPAGNFVWVKGIGAGGFESSGAITLDSVGNLYVMGSYEGTVDFDPGPGITNLTCKGQYDIYITKLDTSGSFIWAKGMGGPYTEVQGSLAVDNNGNVYASGNFEGQADFDPGSGVLQLYTYGGLGLRDAFVVKLDVSGDLVWARKFGGENSDNASSLALDINGEVYFVGSFYDTADFDPGSGTYSLAAPLNTLGCFITKLDPGGNLVWASGITGSGDVAGYTVDVDETGNIYCAGKFTGIADFDPGAGVDTLNSMGNSNAFFLKLRQPGFVVGTAELNNVPNIWDIFPNPASNNLHIVSKEEGILTLLNLQGQVIRRMEIRNGTKQMDISSLVPGFYAIRFSTIKGNDVKSFIKK